MKLCIFILASFFLFKAVASPVSTGTQRSVFFENRFYFSPKLHDGQFNRYQNIGGYFRLQQEGQENWFYDLDLKLQLSLDKSKQHYLDVAQANIGWQTEDLISNPYLNFLKVAIGRYIGDWSVIDHEWQLSMWNPNNMYDPLRAKEQGLIGSFISFGGKYWLVESFVSGLFLPEPRDSLETDDKGTVLSHSRWVNKPRSTFSVFEQDFDSSYNFEEPYLKNVILQTSYMGRVVVGDLNEKWIAASYAYKPLNQVFFKTRSLLSLNQGMVENKIHYQTLKHTLTTVESGFQLGEWWGHMGVLNEEIDELDISQEWISPIIPNYFFASISLSRDFNVVSWSRHSVRFSFLRSWERDSNYRENFIGTNLSSVLALDRFKIQHGYFVSLSSQFLLNKKEFIDLFVRYWYSFEQDGSWLESRLSLHLSAKLSVDLELDILGKRRPYRDSFLGRYGNNDRIILRLHSVF